jgi:hypothetical protein
MKHRKRTIASQVEVCGTRQKNVPRLSEGVRLHLLGGGKKTLIGLVVPRIKHATDLSDSKLLISHHLVAVTLEGTTDQ